MIKKLRSDIFSFLRSCKLSLKYALPRAKSMLCPWGVFKGSFPDSNPQNYDCSAVIETTFNATLEMLNNSNLFLTTPLTMPGPLWQPTMAGVSGCERHKKAACRARWQLPILYSSVWLNTPLLKNPNNECASE